MTDKLLEGYQRFKVAIFSENLGLSIACLLKKTKGQTMY